MPDFRKMTTEEALKYCDAHQDEYIDGFKDGIGLTQFYAVTFLLKTGAIEPTDLPHYGWDLDSKKTPPFSDELSLVDRIILE